MTPVTNNKDLHDEENNHGHIGHEIILHSMPNEDEMAANHPEPEEEEEEEEFEDEMEMHPDAGNTNRGCRFSRSRALTALLATAGVGAVVGGGSVVFRAASGKTNISSSMQAANANVPVDLPGYTFVGIGNCQDAAQKPYPQVIFKGASGETAQLCANKCEECVVGPGGFTFVGFYYYTFLGEASCSCLVSQTDPRVDFSQFRDDGICKADDTDNSSAFSGTGPISSAGPGCSSTCYKVVGGGGSKSGKTKRSKAPKSTN